ncbi:MAG: putative DNA binding domain-containing protein [Acidobacteria bacterium]|nr:putative DNA binding domain-containing protein [Acidobacteriota bacterium]
MKQKKFKPSRSRNKPGSERSFYEKLFNEDYPRLEHLDLLNLIRGGEDSYLELKVRLTNNEKIISEIVALANSGGGAIIFGVNDNRYIEGLDDPEEVEDELKQICRTQITPPVWPYIDKVAFDNGKRIIVLDIDERRAPHYAFDHRYYVREGSSIHEANAEEVTKLFTRLKPNSYESIPLFNTTIENIDEAFVWSYIRELQGELFNKNGNYPTGQVLKDMQLGMDYADNIIPTVAGMLLFGNTNQIGKLFSRSSIELKRISGDSLTSPIVEKALFNGNLATLFERAQNFIGRYVDLWDSINIRKTKPATEPVAARANYNKPVIVEALTNALVHRDYCVREQPIKINIYDNRIEIINPCISKMLSRKGLEAYGAVFTNNPKLKAVFKSSAYGLKTVLGGIPGLRQLAYRSSGREPKINIIQEEFRIEVFGC